LMFYLIPLHLEEVFLLNKPQNKAWAISLVDVDGVTLIESKLN